MNEAYPSPLGFWPTKLLLKAEIVHAGCNIGFFSLPMWPQQVTSVLCRLNTLVGSHKRGLFSLAPTVIFLLLSIYLLLHGNLFLIREKQTIVSYGELWWDLLLLLLWSNKHSRIMMTNNNINYAATKPPADTHLPARKRLQFPSPNSNSNSNSTAQSGAFKWNSLGCWSK